MTQNQLALFGQDQPEPKLPPVREVTLHRLTTACDMDAMRTVFEDQNSAKTLTVTAVRIAGHDAVVVHGLRGGTRFPEWQADARRTTGVDIDLITTEPAVAALIAVDGKVYAFSYGGGHHLIPGELKDPDFGRRFAARALKTDNVTKLQTRPLDVRTRSDQVRIVKGGSFSNYPLSDSDLVSQVKALCDLDGLTARQGGRKMRAATCDDGIRTSLGVEPSHLVNDIRLIERAGSFEPRAGMAQIENQEEVQATEALTELWTLLARGLARPESIELDVVPPLELLDRADTETLYFRITGAPRGEKFLFTTEAVYHHALRRLRHAFSSDAAPAFLKNTRISIYEHAAAKEPISTASLRDWLEASFHHGEELFVLREGRWYRFGARYLDEVNRVVGEALEAGSSVVFPPWPGKNSKTGECDRKQRCRETGTKCGIAQKHHESAYNACVLGIQPGYLCLDGTFAKTSVHDGNGVEVCDVLGPRNELIHVKQASSASTLSHIFIQVRAAVESLAKEPEAQKWLIARAKEADPSRDMADFRPTHVVLGVRLSHSEITVDNLYPLAKVELHRTIKNLRARNVKVEVVGIPHA